MIQLNQYVNFSFFNFLKIDYLIFKWMNIPNLFIEKELKIYLNVFLKFIEMGKKNSPFVVIYSKNGNIFY